MAAVNDIFHFQRLSPRLAIGGQPHANQFTLLRNASIATVVHISVVGAPYTLKNEQGIAESLGMHYLPLTINFTEPVPEDYALFSAIMQENQRNSVYVHCSAGFVSAAMTFLYRVIEGEIELDGALATLIETWKPNTTWQHFINSTLANHGYSTLPFQDTAVQQGV